MIWFCIIIGLALALYVYLTWNFDYWSKLGVPSPRPRVLLGNLPSILLRKRHLTYDFDKIYA